MDNIYSGEYVASYIIDITQNPEDVVSWYIEKYVMPNRWQLKTIDIIDTLDDAGVSEVVEYALYNPDEIFRYEEGEVDPEDLYLPIVLYDKEETILIDGYSRIIKHFLDNKETIEAFVTV